MSDEHLVSESSSSVNKPSRKRPHEDEDDDILKLLFEIREQNKIFQKKLEGVEEKLEGLEEKLEGLEGKFEGVEEKLEGLEGKFEGVEEKLEGVEEKLEGLEEKLEGLEEKQNLIFAYSVESNFNTQNPWQNLSVKSGSRVSGRVNQLRQDFFAHYKLTPENAFCMVTGNNGKLRLAHLLPINVKKSISKSLSMENNINNFRNCLLLSENIEKAYDDQKISFVPYDVLHPSSFKMKVWDNSVLEQTVFFDSKGPKISEFLHRKLHLNMPNGLRHEPYKRCLAYHDFMCFMKWSIHEESLRSLQADFGSDHEGSWLKERNLLLESLRQKIGRESEEEQDDINDDDDDNDLIEEDNQSK